MFDLVTKITNDWVETFSEPDNQNGFMWRMAAEGIMPQGVDTGDKRVIALCAKARVMCGIKKEAQEPRE